MGWLYYACTEKKKGKKGINDRRLTALRDEVNLTRAVNEVRPGREERGGLFFSLPLSFPD